MALLHADGVAVAAPATKVTAAHWSKSAQYPTVKKLCAAYLVKNAIWRIRRNTNCAILTSKGRGNGDITPAEGTKITLGDGGGERGPVAGGGSTDCGAEEPFCVRMGASQGNCVAADVELGEGVGGEVDCEASAGCCGFH